MGRAVAVVSPPPQFWAPLNRLFKCAFYLAFLFVLSESVGP